jgi:hypothetical protein
LSSRSTGRFFAAIVCETGCQAHERCHRHALFPAVGIATKLIVVGASVTFPAAVAIPVRVGNVSVAPSLSSVSFNKTLLDSRAVADKV